MRDAGTSHLTLGPLGSPGGKMRRLLEGTTKSPWCMRHLQMPRNIFGAILLCGVDSATTEASRNGLPAPGSRQEVFKTSSLQKVFYPLPHSNYQPERRPTCPPQHLTLPPQSFPGCPTCTSMCGGPETTSKRLGHQASQMAEPRPTCLHVGSHLAGPPN